MKLTVKNTTGDRIGVMLATPKRVVSDESTTEFTQDDLRVVLT